MRWHSTQLSLLDRLRNPRDDAAWRRFDQLYGEPIVRYARRLGLDWDAAEDARQQVLVGLLHVLPGFAVHPDRGGFRAYLARSVVNAVARIRTRTRTAAQALPLEELPPEAACAPEDPNALWGQEWIDHHLRRAFDTLRCTTDARTIAVFQELLRGTATPDVAGAFQTSPDAVHKIRQRVRARLRQIVQQQVDAENGVVFGLQGEPE